MPKDGGTPEGKQTVNEIAEWLANRGGKVNKKQGDLLKDLVHYLSTRCPPQRPLSRRQRVRHLVCSFWAIIVAREYLRRSKLARVESVEPW